MTKSKTNQDLAAIRDQIESLVKKAHEICAFGQRWELYERSEREWLRSIYQCLGAKTADPKFPAIYSMQDAIDSIRSGEADE